MVLRCYSRRDLLPCFKPGHHLRREFSLYRHATASVRPTATITSRSPSVPGLASVSSSGFLLRISLTARRTAATAIKAQGESRTEIETSSSTPSSQHGRIRSSSASTSISQLSESEPWSFFSPSSFGWGTDFKLDSDLHPLVKSLLSEIFAGHRHPSPNRVWRIYNAIRETSVRNKSLIHQLRPVHHQLVLRAIDPDVARTRKVKRLMTRRRILQGKGAHSSSSGDVAAFFSESLNRQMLSHTTAKAASQSVFDNRYSVKEYVQRVRIVFREMRLLSLDSATSTSGESLPSLYDYNHVFSRLAKGGHLGPMASLWEDLHGLSSKGKADPAATPHQKPNQKTYRELMTCLSKHAADQIERVQKAEAVRAAAVSEESGEARKAVRKTASGLVNFGQVLAPSARGAAILAALRTMSLLQDMQQHDVRPNHITLDLAARTLRTAGHLEGLKVLMKQAFGIDLAAPGSWTIPVNGSGVPRPTVHTLNTILMALGEQTTAPEMISAYETLFYPTPASATSSTVTDTAVTADEGSLFATDWRGLIQSVRERKAEPNDMQSGIDSNVSAEADAVFSDINLAQPNSKTFEVMLRHCCREVDPLRSPAVWPQSVKGRAVPALVQEATATTTAELHPGGARAGEMETRRRGGYLTFARYLLEEAVDITQRHLQATAKHLGIDISPELVPFEELEDLGRFRPGARSSTSEARAEIDVGASNEANASTEVAGESEAETSERGGAESESERAADVAIEPRLAAEVEAQVQAEAEVEEEVGMHDAGEPDDEAQRLHFCQSVSAGRALDAGFLPKLEPASFSITSAMVLPFLSVARRRRKLSQLRWLGDTLSRALSVKLTELRVLGLAWQVFNARLVATKQARELASGEVDLAHQADSVLPLALDSSQHNELLAFLKELVYIYRSKAAQAKTLEWLLYEKLSDRARGIAVGRKQHNKRRKLRFQEIASEEAARKQAEAERVAARRASAAEARRLKELQLAEEEASRTAEATAAQDGFGGRSEEARA